MGRGEWPLGRVIEVLPAADGLVCVVKVKAKGKVYLRPVDRLCPLLITDLLKPSSEYSTFGRGCSGTSLQIPL